MNISYNYPSFNSSNGIGFEIYVSGCTRECKECHNPELWDYNYGNELDYEKLFIAIKPKIMYLDTIIVMGGEPLEQDIEELEELFVWLSEFDKPIWMYTSFSLEEIPNKITKYCSYIKTGRYVEELKTKNNIQYGIELSSSNQNIYKRGVDY